MNRRHGKGFIFPLTLTLAVERAWALETDLHSDPSRPRGAAVRHLPFFPLLSPFVAVRSLRRVRLFAAPWTAHARLPCPSPTPRACSGSWPSSRQCHPTISSSVIPFCRLLPSIFPASGSFLMCQLFVSSGQSTGASAAPSALPVNIQGRLPLGWTGLISLGLFMSLFIYL